MPPGRTSGGSVGFSGELHATPRNSGTLLAGVPLGCSEAVAYARERQLPAFFEYLIRDCLKHRPEGRRAVLQRLRAAAQHRAAPGRRRSSGRGHHRDKHRIGESRWEVTGWIASGNTGWFGGGTVINIRKGVDVNTGEEVAIKVFRKVKLWKEHAGGLFALRVDKMRQLQHPHIVRILDILHTVHRVYVVMDLAPGRLDKRLRESPQRFLGEDQSRRYFQQLMSAVHYCHSKGVAHGDLNLSLCLLDAGDNIKLSHFGTTVLGLSSSAESTDPPAVSTGGPSKTSWVYAAPEVFSDATAASQEKAKSGDVWSCGVCLFEMLTGNLPFQEDTDAKLLESISRGEMSPAAGRRLPAEVRALLKKIFVPLESRLTVDGVSRDPWVCNGDEGWLAAIQHTIPTATVQKGVRSPAPGFITGADMSSMIQLASPTARDSSRRSLGAVQPGDGEATEQNILEEALAQQASFADDKDESSESGSSDDGSGPRLGVNQKVAFGKASGMKKVAAVTAFRTLVPQDEDPEEEVERCRVSQSDTLDLAGLKVAALPALSGLAAHLKFLNLTGIGLQELPDAIGELAVLEELKLRQNKLERLPAALGRLTNMRVFTADDNTLTELPPEFAQLTALEEVGLDWNRFGQIPECLFGGTELRHLHMVNNPLNREGAFPPAACFGKLGGELLVRMENAPWVTVQFDAVVADPAAKGKLKAEWTKVYPDKILDFVYLGPLSCCQDPKVYKELGIGYIASIGRELSVVLGEPGTIEHMQINVDDVPGTDLIPIFDKVHAFMDKAKEVGSAVLVHCFKGQSRSATCVATYIMRKQHMKRDEALAFIRQHRPCINPNVGFMQQMLTYEEHLGL